MDTGELLTRWTIRVSLAFYVLALGSLLLAKRSGYWEPIARLAWTGGCVGCLVHIICAFQFYHAWRHTAAYRDTARQTAEVFGIHWGGGLYFNYGFIALWVVDTVWWWRRPERYRARSRWLTVALHSFFAFMFFNATVVFASGLVRGVGLGTTVGLAIVWLVNKSK